MSSENVATILLLLVIAAELGWVIFREAKSLALSRARLKAAQRALTKERQRRNETTQQLAAPLSEDATTLANLKDAAGQRDQYSVELLSRLEALTRSVNDIQRLLANRPDDDLGEHVTNINARLDRVAADVKASLSDAAGRLVGEQQQLLETISGLSGAERNEIRTLAKILTETFQKGVRVMQVQSRPGSATQTPPAVAPTTQTQATTAAPRPAADAQTNAGPARAAVTEEKGMGALTSRPTEPPHAHAPQADEGSATFESLHIWVANNLDQIMKRSLNQWSKPEELLRDAPDGLQYTARLLDADSKLVLVGTEAASHHLALALPGGYIDTRYYEWFSLPKGIGARVARTVEPALVEVDNARVRVLKRGVITQD